MINYPITFVNKRTNFLKISSKQTAVHTLPKQGIDDIILGGTSADIFIKSLSSMSSWVHMEQDIVTSCENLTKIKSIYCLNLDQVLVKIIVMFFQSPQSDQHAGQVPWCV